MSSTGRGPRGGDGADYFTTPSYCVRRLLEAYTPPPGGWWAEPSAGNGAIIRAVDAADEIVLARAIVRPSRWLAYEIRDEERDGLGQLVGGEGVSICNFLHLTSDDKQPRVSLVLGNPPYDLAFPFLMHCKLIFPAAEIVLLLRAAFTASQERHPFMQSHVPDKFELPERISFDGEGSDSAENVWMRWPVDWERREGRVVMLNQTPLEERKRDRGHRVLIEDPQIGLFG